MNKFACAKCGRLFAFEANRDYHTNRCVGTRPANLHPLCKVCGWRQGGPDQWDKDACKCGIKSLPMETQHD